MTYAVKEMYYTLQGEGANAGRAALFLRFAGCNLWNGREKDRSKAVCTFCDTAFVGTNGPGGGKFKTAEDLAYWCKEAWPVPTPTGRLVGRPRFVVCTGGEPLLQLDRELVRWLNQYGFDVAIETNGTQKIPEYTKIDWVCMSPKAGAPIVLEYGDELKLVYPQTGLMPEDVEHLRYKHFYLQPMDCADKEANTKAAIEYCMAHPKWRLSLQTHKLIGIP